MMHFRLVGDMGTDAECMRAHCGPRAHRVQDAQADQPPPPASSQEDSDSVVYPEGHRSRDGCCKSAEEVRESFGRARIRSSLEEGTLGRGSCLGRHLEVWSLTKGFIVIGRKDTRKGLEK